MNGTILNNLLFKTTFSDINLQDDFFLSLKREYSNFDSWFYKKKNDSCYCSFDRSNHISSFLYVKEENTHENYSDISPFFLPKNRLKIGTLKVEKKGWSIGKKYLEIAHSIAIKNHLDEIYITFFNGNNSKDELALFLKKWDFHFWGVKGEEFVFIKNITPVVLL